MDALKLPPQASPVDLMVTYRLFHVLDVGKGPSISFKIYLLKIK